MLMKQAIYWDGMMNMQIRLPMAQRRGGTTGQAQS
jgi:hypothetical protein